MIFQLLKQQGWTLPVMFKKFCYTLTMVVSLFAASANGAPMAYSVNSDSPDGGDTLYLIDLADGSSAARPLPLFSGAFDPNDVEGLAFDAGGTLWGIDDGLLARYPTLFPINTGTGAGDPFEFISFSSLPSGGRNDFGMTFTCENTLYVTSVINRTLYELDFEGNTQVVGSAGALNADISAIAAIGNPSRLYGLGNGDVDAPSLYSIDVNTGIATAIGPLGAVGDYDEGGLAFDSEGVLWAITDRSQNSQSSQILRIDVDTGAATVVSTTLNEIGFESLAITPPVACTNIVDGGNEHRGIPTLNQTGRLLTILILMFAGMAVLRRRIS